ncbi:hypothetical protein EB796_021104 [Bugula neritina]|uniref:Uncharacterized protein n=1 Tax=Bugula neritina TaxID=10212 RepID=A0A7J7J302_BUGNE|nr:hypothetical protein EB796_021104 [Bugula neritina]
MEKPSLAQNCEFGNVVNDNIKYRLLTGIKTRLSIELQQLTEEQLTKESQRDNTEKPCECCTRATSRCSCDKEKKCSAKKAYNGYYEQLP